MDNHDELPQLTPTVRRFRHRDTGAVTEMYLLETLQGPPETPEEYTARMARDAAADAAEAKQREEDRRLGAMIRRWSTGEEPIPADFSRREIEREMGFTVESLLDMPSNRERVDEWRERHGRSRLRPPKQ